MSKPHIIVPVELGSRSYDIIIGSDLLAQAGDIIARNMPTHRAVVLTDETVYKLHGQVFMASLQKAGLRVDVIVRPAGEAQKSFAALADILSKMLDLGLGRKDSLIALGGGVVGDLAGFAASIYKRGCQFIQVPTTLLAQVDSSVGGKTAINMAQGKNMVGSFYQPQLVLADSDVLKTLPDRQVKAGYAEILKYALLGDAPFFDWLETYAQDVLTLSPEALHEAVAVSCRAKARIVAADEREQGQRALLNLGHTFAHALEAEAGYGGRILHGEAVSAGMDIAAQISTYMDICPAQDSAKISDHLMRHNMPMIAQVKDLIRSSDICLSHMMHDKKNEDDKLTLILMRGIGSAFINKNVDISVVRSYLDTLTT